MKKGENPSIFIGLMSGTSVDGVDCVAVDFRQNTLSIINTAFTQYPDNIRKQITGLFQPGSDEIRRTGELDIVLGALYADAVLDLISKSKIRPANIAAIGCHGQTVRHCPPSDSRLGFTLQIGNPHIIAQKTGITTIADFRSADMASGGQGAPLVPAFHRAVFHSSKKDRVILNIGGIANITILKKNGSVYGFDTGPGNTLLDNWIQKTLGEHYDKNGDWSAGGQMHKELLKNLLSDTYLQAPAPKSTGPEHFNLGWLQKKLADFQAIPDRDIQATLVHLTAESITTAINTLDETVDEVFVCGGGSHNTHLMQTIQNKLLPITVDTTSSLGVDADWVEAVAFAWLAKCRIEMKPGNLPLVTGARRPAILGAIYEGTTE
ncbi:MAG: anhydro-N-acetylmuramic acid kinase [Pseudomonadales bacterium]|nr:anhydro-N-acetylmuramic acid kinase [Pseudomonadales bacterium]